MTYLLPAVIDPPDYIKICVTIPNRPEYVDAFLGSYNYLGRWTAWEQDGTTRARDAARVWLIAIQDTITRWENCEEDMATIINNYTNVNCGGCGGGLPTTIICYLQDGTPVITPQPPAEPVVPPPVGDVWPVNPITDPVPEAFEDWTQFDIEACAASNGLWQAVYGMVTWAEGGIDLVATIAVIVAFLIPGIGTAIVAALGGTAIVTLASILVKIILTEQASDILSECRTWLEENKEEVICLIFQYRHDIPTMQLELVRSWFAWVDSVLDLNDVDQDNVREWGRAIFPLNLLMTYFFEYQRYIEASAPIDCSACGAIGAGIWTPGGEGSFCTNDGIDYQVYANGLQFSGNISKEGEFGSYEYTLSVVPASGETHQFEGRNLSFYSVNSRTVPCIITATTSGGDQQVAVANDTADTLDLTGLTVTAVQFKWQIGIYNLSCPQELSGYVTWEDA